MPRARPTQSGTRTVNRAPAGVRTPGALCSRPTGGDMADSKDELGSTTRRVMLGGVGATGLLGLTGALAACGDDAPATNSAGQQPTNAGQLTTTAPQPSGTPVVLATSPSAGDGGD